MPSPVPAEALQPNPMRRSDWIIGCCLLLATWLLYLPVLGHDFVWYDDASYLLDNAEVNQGLSWAGLRWAFSEAHSSNWHPLTWLSHMLDCELFGLEAGGHHLMSVGIHGLNALLCFLVLRSATGARWASALAAGLFALHPLRVQSVAWASERKDLLAGLFFFLCLGAYLRYARKPSSKTYAWVVLSLVLGLLCKPMLVTLPVVLLLFDSWPLGRFRTRHWRQLVLEKLPLFAIVLLSIVVTVLAQDEGGAFRFASSLPVAERFPHAATSVLHYLRSSFWPTDLACFYPHPALVDPAWNPWLASLLPLSLGLALSFGWKRMARLHPEIGMGILWMLLMLAPVIGIVQVGEQAWADRYAYLPTLGLYIAVIWPLAKFAEGRPRAGWCLGCLAGLALLGAALRTHQELPHWKNTESLARQALLVTESNYVAHLGLGNELLAQGEFEGAQREFDASRAIRPDNTELVLSQSALYLAEGKHAEAIGLYGEALERYPKWVFIRMRLGIALAKSGRIERALQELERAREGSEGSIEVDHNLALVYLQAGRPEAALPLLNACLQSSERFFDARIARGEAYFQLRQYPAAKRDLLRGARVAPEKAAARLALLLASAPGATTRDGQQALEWANKAMGVNPDAGALEALAAAQAELGRFDMAQATQRRAIEALPEQLRAAAVARLAIYQDQAPYRLPQ